MEYKLLETDGKLLKAMLSIEDQILPIKAETDNDFTRSKYLNLATLLREVKPILQSAGLLLVQTIDSSMDAGALLVTVGTRIYHTETGEFISTSGTMGLTEFGKANPTQKLMGTSTYLRRYQLLALLGTVGADDDDDGNSSPVTNKTPEVPQRKPGEHSPRDEKWKSRLSDIAEIVKSAEFSDEDRTEFRRAITTAATMMDLNRVYEDAKTALSIKQRKQGEIL